MNRLIQTALTGPIVALAVVGSMTWPVAAVSTQAAVNLHPIEAYADITSAEPGQVINFFSSLPKNSDGSQRTAYTVTYYRFGAGEAVAPVAVLGPIAQTNGINQGYTATSYLDGAGWSESFDLTVPAN